MRSGGRVAVTQMNRIEEAKSGADIEIWHEHPSGLHWCRFAVQAKKINIRYERYGKLGYKPNNQSTQQFDILNRYALKHRAIPLYLLYNYIGLVGSIGTHCCLGLVEKAQLGCTTTPLTIVRQSINTGRNRFSDLHRSSDTALLRCLTCPNAPFPQNVSKEDYTHPSPPNFMQFDDQSQSVEVTLDDLYSHGYDVETGVPSRIWVMGREVGMQAQDE